MSLFDTRKIQVFFCEECNRTMEKVDINEYTGQEHCQSCHNPVQFVHHRKSKYVTIAMYEVSHVYGGPEEGGWYYDYGSIVNGTQRSFLEEDAPQADVYKELLLHRIEKDLMENPYSDIRLQCKCWPESEAPNHFPKNRPQWG